MTSMRDSDAARAGVAAGFGRRSAGRGLAQLLQRRGLISELVHREVKGGHAQHGLGAAWFYVQPLIVVATFMLVFGVVIGARMDLTASFPGDYTSYILVGLVPWLVTANALARAPSVLVANANLVKQVVFPIETLPIASVGAAFLMFLPAFALAGRQCRRSPRRARMPGHWRRHPPVR